MSHYMKDGEIRSRYRNMNPGKESIQILADLNGCAYSEIAIVIGGDEMGKINHDKAMELYKKGFTDQTIAKQFGLSAGAVWAWRKKNGLEANAKAFGKQEKPAVPKPPKPEKRKPATINPEFDKAVDDMIAEMPKKLTFENIEAVNDLAKEFNETAFVEISVDDFIKTIVAGKPEPVIQQPSADDFLDEIERLKLQIAFLRGVAIGAGIRDIDSYLREVIP